MALIDAAEAAGVRRYVMVSSIGAQDPSSAGPQMQPYLEAKAEADEALTQSELDWTVVRPGGLTDDEGTGRVAGRDDARAARADPARRRRGGARGRALRAADDRQDLRGVHGRHADRGGPAAPLTRGGDGRRRAALIRRAPLVHPGACCASCASRTSCSSNGPSCASAPGLNVLTGETGAGKTVLAHALDLLLGGRARGSVVRPGAAEAYVEGVFDLPDALRHELGERLPADAEEVVLARRVSAEGRTRAYVNGRSASVGDLRDLAEPLVAFYGQHEHRRLTLASAQLALLDDACGPEQAARRDACAAAWARARALERTLAELRERAAGRERELDLLAFELAEIEEAAPDEAEEAELRARRERLRHLEALRAAAWGAAEARRARGRRRRGRAAGRRRRRARRRSPASTRSSTRWPSAGAPLAIEADDVAAELRRYAEGARGGARGGSRPSRSGWPSSTACSASTAGRSRPCSPTPRRAARAARSSRAPRWRWPRRRRRCEGARAEHAALAAELHEARAAQAPRLADAPSCARLADLAMEGATFAIELADREARADGRGRGRVPDRAQRRRAAPARCARSRRAASSRG